MSIANHLRATLPHLQVTRPLYARLSEHHLAACARDAEMRRGQVLNPLFSPRTWHMPYYAARPVAPHMRGVRTAGFQAGALWGASVAVSLLRNELPSLTVYGHMFWQSSVASRPADHCRQAAASRQDESEGMATVKAIFHALMYGPMIFGAWELAFGHGMGAPGAAHADARQPAWHERLRGPGVAGDVIGYLAVAATAHRAQVAEVPLLAAACVLACVNEVFRAASMTMVGSVACVGAACGLVYEALSQAVFYAACARSTQPLQVRPVAAVERAEQAAIRERLQELDDTDLPYPLIDALWRRTTYVPNENFWVNITLGAGDLLEHYRNPQRPCLVDTINERRPRRWGTVRPLPHFPQPAGHGVHGRNPAPGVPLHAPAAGANADDQAVPHVADLGTGAQNVHGIGRDAATRRAIAALLTDDPHRNALATCAELETFIGERVAENGPFAQRRHASGQTLCTEALFMLTGQLPPTVTHRPGQSWAYVTEPGATYNVDGHGNVPLADIIAVLVRLFRRLEAPAIPDDPGGTAAATALLRQERLEALVCALADNVQSDGARLCAGGCSQRAILVAQGFDLPGNVRRVQVERYDAAQTVAQFVSYVTQAIDSQLPKGGADGPSEHDVRPLYDDAYADGCAIYGNVQRQELAEHLRAVAQHLYEVDWRPPL